MKWLYESENLKKFSLLAPEQNIDISSFKNCNNLEEISFEEVILEINQFPTNLGKLRVVDLSKCKFTFDPEYLFANLNSLEEVSLVLCKYANDQHARKLFRNLKNLKKLIYKTEFISHIRTRTKREKNCSYILRQAFISLEHIIDNNPNMSDLNLSGNSYNISGLESLSGLSSIGKLNMSYNSINSLNDEIFNGLVLLEELNFSNNNISHISNKVFGNDLKNLIELNLSGNLKFFNKTH